MKFYTRGENTKKVAGIFDGAAQKLMGRASLIKSVLVGTLHSFTAFLLGLCVLPFGARAIGIGYLCAANKKLPYIFAGLCVSAFFADDPAITLGAYVITFLVRILVRLTIDVPWSEREDSGEIELAAFLPTLFCESVYLRMATSTVGVFCTALYTLIKGGFLYYDLIGAIIAMLSAPVFVLLSQGEFSGRNMTRGAVYLSRALIGFFAVYSANEISIYGASLSVFIAMIAALYVTRRLGVMFGMGTGAILGLAVSPVLAPAFVVAAITFGALIKVSDLFAAMAAFGLGFAYILSVRGIDGVMTFMPAALCACLLFAVLDRTFLDRETRKKIKNDKAKSEASEAITSEVAMSEALVSERLLATCERYNTLCDTLLSMSEFFSELGDKMKTPLLCDTKNICDSAFDASCASCKHRGLCYEEKREETMAVINDISAALHRNGSVSVNDVGGHIRSVCQRLHDMLSEINYNYSIYQRQLILCDKTEIFATDYKAMRDLICGAMRLDADDFAVQKELSERLIAKLSEGDLNVVSAVVYGTGRLRVLVEGKWEKALKETKDNILETVKTSLEREFALEKESGARIVFCEKKRISAKYATRTASSVLEKEFCGDSSAVFENPDGMLYSVISDGMGSGRDAALTSGICVMFMQKMLLSGADCRTAISLLGAFLRNKGSGSVHECSATLDVMELDTVMGKAVFYKSGAAPTFVMREGRVYKLESRNLPLGIIKDTDTKKLSFEIDDGDIIVMVSDGVCGCGDGAPWLSKLLKEKAERESPKSLAGLILERAKSENESDDISVSVIKIEKER